MLNKKGDAADLFPLFVATIVITVILVGFVVISGIVKEAAGVKVGEKIFNDTEVGVGDMKEYMENYGYLVEAERLISEGESVDVILDSSGYANSLDNAVYGPFEKVMKFLGGLYVQ